jgi:hypothetical protein
MSSVDFRSRYIMAQEIDATKNLLRVNRLLNPIRRLGGMAIASAVRVAAIRRYAMARAVPLRIQTENYPTLEAKYLDNPRLYAEHLSV